jgi:hypothetical protein
MTSPIYTAIIVEPRKHKALEFVLTNFSKNLDQRWEFIIYHGTENEEFVKEIVERNKLYEAHSFQFVNILVANLGHSKEYSSLFYTPSFYEPIRTEMFLVFQTDTLISSKNKHKIYDFMQYDYVGSPWYNILTSNGEHEVGNGGLSLRRKSKMLELIELYGESLLQDYSQNEHLDFEDRFFSGTCSTTISMNIHKPDWETARNIAVEQFLFTKNPFGIHKPWAWLSSDDMETLSTTVDGLYVLRELNQ